jgi:hypothetical protein
MSNTTFIVKVTESHTSECAIEIETFHDTITEATNVAKDSTKATSNIAKIYKLKDDGLVSLSRTIEYGRLIPKKR